MIEPEKELAPVGVVQQPVTPPRKVGRPRKRDEDLVKPRRERRRTQEEVWAENLAALPEVQRAELIALSEENWMCNKMMRDVGWLSIGYGTAGVDRVYPDLAFEAVKAHIRASGGLLPEYAKKDSEMPEIYKRYGLLTQLYAQDFRPFVYQVAAWCHAHPEENFDREIETECTLISGWRPQTPSASIAKLTKVSIQAKDAEEAKRQADRLLGGIREAERKIFNGES